MKKRKKLILTSACLVAVAICLLFGSCIFNSDEVTELSGDYFYRDEGQHDKSILSHLPDKQEIYGEVIGYNYNSDFIIAAQKPNYEVFKSMIAFNLRSDLKRFPKNDSREISLSERMADSIIRNEPIYKNILRNEINYWIIAHRSGNLFGPLSKNEYDKRRTILNIPEQLKIPDQAAYCLLTSAGRGQASKFNAIGLNYQVTRAKFK